MISNKKLSISLTLSLIIVSCTLTYFANEYIHSQISKKTNSLISEIDSQQQGLYKIDRLAGYRLISPIVYAEPVNEAAKYADIKEKLNSRINEYLKSKKLISASVYIRDFDQGNWITINGNETYNPGSLLKVVGLFTYLKMSESQPGLLSKQLSFDSPKEFIPSQTYNSKQIQLGKKYTIRELLKYMISYSDNNATYLLKDGANMDLFNKVFKDLKIQGPNDGDKEFKISAKDYSVFLKVLYNASYLNRENSEYALELLNGSDFKLGIVKGVPANILVVNKFGEMWDSTGKQLHESALVYSGKVPYLLTVMTKGNNADILPEVISSISQMVYDYFKNVEVEPY